MDRITREEENMSEAPVPAHLQDIFMQRLEKRKKKDTFSVMGGLRCSCGCEAFKVHFCGEAKRKHIEVLEFENTFVVSVVAACRDCGRKWVIFDSQKHGWENVCGEKSQSHEMPSMQIWYCRKCSGKDFFAAVRLTSYSQEAFAEDYREEIAAGNFSASDWKEAFCWIALDLSCTACGRKTKNWLDYECS